MSEQQVAKLAGAIVEHQRHFNSMSTDDRQWAIQNTVDAIKLFAESVGRRNSVIAQDATRVITLNETTIAVNLAATPKLPFDGAKVEQHTGEGWVIIEKRADGLYINGRKVTLHLSKRQMGGKAIGGHDLREELTGKPVLNANILDALYENPHLIPEDWKTDADGNIRYIFFWGTIYRSSGDDLYVRYLCFRDGVWDRRCGWLGDDWGGYSPAAVSASN